MAQPPSKAAVSLVPRIEPPEPSLAIWISFAAMIFGNFMSLLDVQIVASSIADIQAGVSATRDEVSWVQTSYLIAEVIAIPLSGFLGQALGVRILFSVGAVLFALMSMCCAISWDLQSLIVFRTLQGFVGGALVPTTMSMMYLAFPSRFQPITGAMIGLVSTLAPTMGPTLGGWIAETLSWRWLFWVNVIPGFLISSIVWANLRVSKPNMEMLKQTDFIGLIGLAMMLGSAQYVLEQGPRDGWDAGNVVACMATAALGVAIFFSRAFNRPHPIVNLRPFANPSFAIATILALVLGAAIYGPVFLQPLFLAQIRGYNPMQIGHTMFAQGLVMMACVPFTSRIMMVVSDPRPIAAFAFGIVGLSCWLQSQLTAESSFWEFVIPQMLRGVGMMLSFVTVMRPAFASLPMHLVQSATGLFNLVRNVGGAFGLAILISIQNHSFALHKQELYAAANPALPKVQDMMNGIAAHMSELGWRGDPEQAAVGQYKMFLDREAMVMTFNDQFMFLTIALAIAALGVWLMRKPPPIPPPLPAGSGPRPSLTGGH
jgi:DHA2 family multidrug resistance protein